MRLGSRQFSPPWWAWLVFVAIAAVMLMLGRWQLDRAAEKVSMREAADAARDAPAKMITEINDVKAAANAYTRVKISGEWLADRQFLWDNRTHKGRAGFEVITPMRTADGLLVLINRGWLPLGASRDELPDVSLPSELVDSVQTVTGYFTRPSKGFAGGDASSRDADWPKLLQFYDYPLIEDLLSAAIVPGVVQVLELDAAGGGVTKSPTLVDSVESPGLWLTGNWQADASGPAKHYSYAFQWFAMATALAVIFVVVNLKRVVDA